MIFNVKFNSFGCKVKIMQSREDVSESVIRMFHAVAVSDIFPVDVREICPKVVYVSVREISKSMGLLAFFFSVVSVKMITGK